MIGIVSPQGKRVISYGQLNEKNTPSLDGNTLFEIGSVTKVFTGIVLAEMVQKKKIVLDDPISKYLPDSVQLPELNGRSISILDLVTHTSTLPFMPPNDISNRNGLYEYVASCRLSSGIGSRWDYSNLGYWLLSEALAYKAKSSFEKLLQQQILTPFNLTSTGFTLTDGMKSRLAVGYDASLQKAPSISSLPVYSLMPAAGNLYSSVNDLMKFLSVVMGYEKPGFSGTVEVSLQKSRPINNN